MWKWTDNMKQKKLYKPKTIWQQSQTNTRFKNISQKIQAIKYLFEEHFIVQTNTRFKNLLWKKFLKWVRLKRYFSKIKKKRFEKTRLTTILKKWQKNPMEKFDSFTMKWPDSFKKNSSKRAKSGFKRDSFKRKNRHF